MNQQPTCNRVAALSHKHLTAVTANNHWRQIWQLFCDDDWFIHCLEKLARVVAQRNRLRLENVDDVKQEALLLFAKALQRNPLLGFENARGNYGQLIHTIVYRCCLKSLRQFSHVHQSLDPEIHQPYVNRVSQLDDQLDLNQAMTAVDEPERFVIQAICDGWSIQEIARKRGRSTRTIYRWMNKGIGQLQSLVVEDQSSSRKNIPPHVPSGGRRSGRKTP